jgi:hypothetical protein
LPAGPAKRPALLRAGPFGNLSYVDVDVGSVRFGSGQVTDTERADGALVANQPQKLQFAGPSCHALAMPRTARLDGVPELLKEQLGLITRGQLLALGVYLSVSGEPNLLQKQMAALLYAGPGSLITGPVALLHYNISGAPDLETIDVLLPGERHRVNTGFVRIHRTYRMPGQFTSTGPLRFASPARAVADTAGRLTSLREVRAVVAGAVQLGRCTVSQLADELRDGPIRHSALFRTVLSEVADGIRSTTEGDLRDLIKKARLPMPLFNPSLYQDETFISRPDAWWPDAGVAVEVDSREWHLGPAEWERTMARHTLMGALGIIPLHFSPGQIRREPAIMVQRITDALESGRKRPALPIRTVPCPTSVVGQPSAIPG